jgi:hypothetical protein
MASLGSGNAYDGEVAVAKAVRKFAETGAGTIISVGGANSCSSSTCTSFELIDRSTIHVDRVRHA